MAAEHGDAKRRGLWASWPQAGVPLGSLLSAGILALMAGFQSEADFIAWGWRVPFLLSAVLVVVGWYIRNRVAETPAFQAQLDEAEIPPKLPAMDVFRERPRAILLGAGLRVGENIVYYILTVFSLTFLVDVATESRSLALDALLIGAAVQFIAIPLLAILSDRIGRRPVYAFGAFGLAIFGGEKHRSAPFTADRETLEHAQHDEPDGRPHADTCIARQEPDQQRRDAHHDEAPH
jgi:MFS family permease